MRRRVRYAIAFLVAVGAGFAATVVATPWVIMHVVMDRLSEEGRMVNRFRFGDRTTARSRQIVRPSPDLAYASCVYDLSRGPIIVNIAPGRAGGYVSVSVFAANSDNIAVLDSLSHPGGIRFVLQKERKLAHPGLPVVYTPTERGIILDRRLAAGGEEFAAADRARRADDCGPFSSAATGEATGR